MRVCFFARRNSRPCCRRRGAIAARKNFVHQNCSTLCHTLKDANAEGAVGPVLDEIKPDTARIIKALQNGIGQMPSYKASLSDTQIQAIADYVVKAVSN